MAAVQKNWLQLGIFIKTLSLQKLKFRLLLNYDPGVYSRLFCLFISIKVSPCLS